MQFHYNSNKHLKKIFKSSLLKIFVTLHLKVIFFLKMLIYHILLVKAPKVFIYDMKIITIKKFHKYFNGTW